MEWPDGSKYEGQWAGGRMNGKGKYTWHDGRVFNGFFKKEEDTTKPWL
jgi:hypothetical protein